MQREETPQEKEARLEKVKAAIGEITNEEWLRLRRIARHLTMAREDYVAEDVMHDVLVALIEGRRRWPEKVPFPAWFAMTVKSFAWHTRWNSYQSIELQSHPETTAPEPSPTFETMELVQKLLRALPRDSTEAAIVNLLVEGYEVKEIREELALTEKEYEKLRRRIKRTAQSRGLLPAPQ